uniref:SAM domain-containing protein n=1 Tax=Strongyloides stercoralis TaxID=6248 RepID=A0A0K0DW44_STRER
MTDPQDSDQELRIDESPENDILCPEEFNVLDIKKNASKNYNNANNSEKYEKNCTTLENKNADNNLDNTTIITNEKVEINEIIKEKINDSNDVEMKNDNEYKSFFEKKAASHSPKLIDDINGTGKHDIKKKDTIKDIKDIHKEIILKPSTEGLLKIPQNCISIDETLISSNNQYINRNSRASSVCSSSSLQKNKRKSNTPKHVNFISERINSSFEESEVQKQKILDILQGASTDTEPKCKREKRKSEDSEENFVIEKKISEDKILQQNNICKNDKLPISKILNNAETTLGKLLGEKEKADDKHKEVVTKNSVNVASPKDANFAPIKPKPSPAMIFKPMKYQTSPNLSSQSASLNNSKSPTKNSGSSLSNNNKDNSTLVVGNKQLNAIAQMSKNISKTNGQSQGKSLNENDLSQSNSTTPSTILTAPQSKKRTQYHKMMNRSQGEPTVREMLSPQIKYSRNKAEQQAQSMVSRPNGIMTQNASFINYPTNVYPQQMLVAAGYPNFPGQPVYSNTPYSYLVPASNNLPTQILNESTSPPKLAPVIDNTTTEINGNKTDSDDFKEMPDIQHTKTQVKDDNTSAKENSKPTKIKKLIDEKDIEEVSRAFEKEAEKCNGLRGGRKRKILKHSLDGGTMIEEHPEPPKHVLKKSLEKIVPKTLLENARSSKDKKKLNVPTPEKRKGSSKEIQRLLDMDFGVGKSPFEETNYDKYTQSILKLTRENEEKLSPGSVDNSKKGYCLQCNTLLPTPRTRKSEIKFCNKDCEKQYNTKNRRSLRDNVSLSNDGAKESEPSSSKDIITEVKKGRGGRRSKNAKVEPPIIVETPKTSKKASTPKQSPNMPAPNLVPEVPTPEQMTFKSPSSKSTIEEDKSSMPILESAKSPSLSPQVTPKEAIANSIFTIEGLDVYKVKSWTPYEVMLWVNGLCKNELGQIFKDEEIDGECLLILDKETLKQHLQFKVGPSMKILEEIKKLKELQKLS